MKLTNKCMLITYADSLGENLKDLDEVLDTHFADAVGGVHILPFFPSSADRGFAPMRYDIVDPAFGDWADVKAIGDDRYLMFDFMINHISRQSPFMRTLTVSGACPSSVRMAFLARPAASDSIASPIS